MKRIYLHLGTHKTGSTSLQNTFHAYRETLAEHGLTYLGTDGPYPCLYSAYLADPMNFGWNRHSGLTVKQLKARDTTAMADLDRQIDQSPTDDIIISSEYLAQLPEPRLNKLRQHLAQRGQVTAIYFYRELLSWTSSDTQQLAKGGHRSRPTPYETAVQRIHDLPLRTRRVFGADRSVYIRFEDAVRDGICNSFLAALGLPTLASMGLTEIHANESVSENAVRALMVFNKLFPLGAKNRPQKLRKRLMELEGPKYRIAGFTGAQIEDYAAKHAEVRDKLGLTLQPPSEIPVSESPDPMADALFDVIERYLSQQKQGS